ncbi:MAG: 3-deoxy-manno-octulosonate cytidylyltransferase [Candidatus Omnitrophica bacterium]|nr:3-deoxy-manno-octulosonate cytidylyltransferase [Candidatus Omnitrophota bacterium]
MKRRYEGRIIGIIPARMASSRFPGKPLARICGMPMIGHVYLRSKMSRALDDVYMATCDTEIADYTASIGGKAIMTSDKHQRASDRIAEAAVSIERLTGGKIDIVVMIQGDEPMLRPEMIEEAVAPLCGDKSVIVTNLMAEMDTEEEFDDPNEIKVVVDKAGDALYFSREPIPSRKKASSKVPMLKQVCVIPFRRDFLTEYTKMPPTPLEEIESIDMLRILENGRKVRMVPTKFRTYSVDTPEDLRAVEDSMRNDALLKKYCTADKI